MSNPVLARAAFANAGITPAEGRMTLAGAVTKTGALIVLCAIAAAGIWVTSTSLGPSMPVAIMVAALLGGEAAVRRRLDARITGRRPPMHQLAIAPASARGTRIPAPSS